MRENMTSSHMDFLPAGQRAAAASWAHGPRAAVARSRGGVDAH
ncbi:hypothetical protein [Kitasatospora sp. HPMI-4]